MRALTLLTVVVAMAALVGAHPGGAIPVASNEQERQALGRVFPEPIRSVDFINHGPTNGPEELRTGFELLERT